MTPREELLATQTFGPAGVALLYKTVAQVARMRGLPPPEGHQHWDDEAVTEAANEVFADVDGAARFYELAATSHDDTSFRNQLWTTVYRALVDQGRRTQRGRLALRLQEELHRMPDVQLEAGVYSLDGADGPPGPVRFDELVQAVSNVPVVVPAWSEDAARQAPFADRDSIVALLLTLLGVTPDGLRLTEIVQVISVRLGVHNSATPTDHDVLGAHLPAHPGDVVAAVADRAAADELLAQLTPEQQMVLPYLDATVTEVVNSTGLKRNKAWRVLNETRDLLATLLTDDSQGAATLREAALLSLERWPVRP